MNTDGSRVIASASGLGVLARLVASLRRLDWVAVDEARQVPGVTYADKVRALPVHDAILSRGYPTFRRPPVAGALHANIETLTYPAPDGVSRNAEAYADMMRRVDAITGTTGLGRV